MTERTCTYYDRRRRLRCTECNSTVDLCQCVEVDEAAFQRLNTERGKFLRVVWEQARSYEGGNHLLEAALSELGMVAMHLVKNDADRSIPDEEIYHKLANLAATVTLLAAVGTPEYAYPSN